MTKTINTKSQYIIQNQNRVVVVVVVVVVVEVVVVTKQSFVFSLITTRENVNTADCLQVAMKNLDCTFVPYTVLIYQNEYF